MEQYYKLDKIKELADNDNDFISTLAQAFLEEVPADAKTLKEAVENKNYLLSYKTAHKMKPTVDLFDLGVLDDLIEVQDWGKFEQKDKNIIHKLEIVLNAIEKASQEIKQDFNI